MTKQFQVGKQYKLVDASKCPALAEVIGNGQLQLPEGGIFTCHNLDSDGDCLSHTEGVLWEGHTGSDTFGKDILCAALGSFNAGAFEEVADVQGATSGTTH